MDKKSIVSTGKDYALSAASGLSKLTAVSGYLAAVGTFILVGMQAGVVIPNILHHAGFIGNILHDAVLTLGCGTATVGMYKGAGLAGRAAGALKSKAKKFRFLPAMLGFIAPVAGTGYLLHARPDKPVPAVELIGQCKDVVTKEIPTGLVFQPESGKACTITFDRVANALNIGNCPSLQLYNSTIDTTEVKNIRLSDGCDLMLRTPTQGQKQ